MTPATASLVEVPASCAATREGFFARFHHQTAFNEPSEHPHSEGNAMFNSLGTNPHLNRGDQYRNKHLRSDTRECSDWLQHQFRRQSAKDIADQAGVGLRAAEGVKQGRNGLTMSHLVSICRANPEFRAALFHFMGGELEGNPEMVAALSKAINAVMQRHGGGA